MPRKIDRSPANIHEIPPNCTIVKKTGYVLANISNTYVKKQLDGTGGHSDHRKVGIGYAVDPANWKANRMLYANQNYYKLFKKDALPLPPIRSDNISVGLFAVIRHLSREAGLTETLSRAFGEKGAMQVLDLASYMVSEESARFQHFPHWARRHALFSPSARSDSALSAFLRDSLSVSRINQFKQDWAHANIGDSSVYLCYDSTNVNCQAEGVYLVQKGHAKDDPTLEQVNTDYVVRQGDGLPVTFMEFPGSVVDVAQASEMISFFSGLGEDAVRHVTLTCDRGYISERNVEQLDEAGIGFLLMLRRGMGACGRLLGQHAGEVKAHRNCLADSDEFGIAVQGRLFDRPGEAMRHIVILWSQDLEAAHRASLYKSIKSRRKELEESIRRGTSYSQEEIDRRFPMFRLSTEPSGTITVNRKGPGNKGKTEDVPALAITSYADNDEVIDGALRECGYRILACSRPIQPKEAREAYSKRDCVEKVFEALKGSLGMDSMGVTTDGAIHGKSLVWFVAAIIHSLLFSKLEGLRASNRKYYTVPAAVRCVEEISADKDLDNGFYARRYQFDKRQKAILSACGVKTDDIDEIIRGL